MTDRDKTISPVGSLPGSPPGSFPAAVKFP